MDTPIVYKLWFAFCALLSVASLAFMVWVVLELLDLLRAAA